MLAPKIPRMQCGMPINYTFITKSLKNVGMNLNFELTKLCLHLGWFPLCVGSSMSCIVRWISLEWFSVVLSCNLYFCTSLVDCVVTETSWLPAASSRSSLDTEGELRGKTLSAWCLHSLMDAAALVAVFLSRLVMLWMY